MALETSEKVTNILVGPVTLYAAPTGTTLPADTVAAGGAWPAGWAKVGYTLEGAKAGYTFDSLAIAIEEALGDVDARKTHEGFAIEVMLAEFNLTNLQRAWGGATVTETAAGVGQPGKESFSMGGTSTIQKLMWGLEGSYVSDLGNTHPIRLFVFRGSAEEGAELEWSKSKMTGIPLKIRAFEDMTRTKGARLFQVDKITAPAS